MYKAKQVYPVGQTCHAWEVHGKHNHRRVMIAFLKGLAVEGTLALCLLLTYLTFQLCDSDSQHVCYDLIPGLRTHAESDH